MNRKKNKDIKYNDLKKKINLDNENKNTDQYNNLQSNDDDFIDPIIRNSLEYYDNFQPKINKILNKTEYIETINNGNITDNIIFYDLNDNIIFKSKFEILSFFLPDKNIWKWSWSLPTTNPKNTFISRKILEYAFTLNHQKDYLIKSTLINSHIKIVNQIQLDIYIAIAAMLSKKPFILKMYMVQSETKYYRYREIVNNPKKNEYISVYVLILDWNNE